MNDDFYRRNPGMVPTFGVLVRKFRWALLFSAFLWFMAFVAVLIVGELLGSSP